MDRSRVFYLFLGMFAACVVVAVAGAAMSRVRLGMPHVNVGAVAVLIAVWVAVGAMRRRKAADN